MLKSKIYSSSSILKFSKFVVRSHNLDILTLGVSSWTVLRISQIFFAWVYMLINLNIFLSTPLKITFKAIEFPRASLSSILVHSASSFKVNDQSSRVNTWCFQHFTTTFHVCCPWIWEKQPSWLSNNNNFCHPRQVACWVNLHPSCYPFEQRKFSMELIQTE